MSPSSELEGHRRPIPRFLRAAAASRLFVDREGPISAFDEEIERVGGTPRLLNFTGPGGMGKSRLLRELRARVDEGTAVADLDLSVPAMCQQVNALVAMRTQLGESDVRFDRFDIAFSFAWQRMHPHLRLSESELPFLDSGSILADLFDNVTSVPILGSVTGVIELGSRAKHRIERWHRARRDGVLRQLDSLSMEHLSDALTHLFAEDLNSSSDFYLLTVDSYESLVPDPLAHAQAVTQDLWLRDLISQCTNGLVLLASREPLRWHVADPSWSAIIRRVPLDDLPDEASQLLLESSGITEPALVSEVLAASGGLPFYLNLAIDALRDGDAARLGVATQTEILQRFLQHARPENFRSWELLSATRWFDFHTFKELAAPDGLPHSRLSWESVTAYSFVYRLDHGYRLHQVMAEALWRGVAKERRREIHNRLSDLWRSRAQLLTEERAQRARATREWLYHGLRAHALSGLDLVTGADQMLDLGGISGLDGVLADLSIVEQDKLDVRLAIACLQAERALRHGAAADALAAASSMAVDDRSEDPLEGRIVIARANALRIAGETEEALRAFESQFRHGSGAPRLAGGLWTADLLMARGHFQEAESVAQQLLQAQDASDRLRGDAYLLLHRSRRFQMDLDTAEIFLRRAMEVYESSGSDVALAEAETNRIELLALTRPARALAQAESVLELQRQLAAQHEIGKVLTAMGLALILEGRDEEAELALAEAARELDACGYRSGRARAEVYFALVRARQGRIAESLEAAEIAVTELRATTVYPTLVLAVAIALDRLGVSSELVRSAAQEAAGQIRVDAIDGIMEALRSLVKRAMEAQPPAYLDRARSEAQSSQGYYNQNIALLDGDPKVIVRIPLPKREAMDVAVWREEAVLRVAHRYVDAVPAVLYVAPDHSHQVHEYVDGVILDALYPRGTPVPDFVFEEIGRLFHQLAAIPRTSLPALPEGWASDGDTAAFALHLVLRTEQVYRRFADPFRTIFEALGVTDGHLDVARAGLHGLEQRPFNLVHADIHRKNLIVDGQRLWLIDWELALWGDPLYELAVHLHKMGYLSSESAQVVDRWVAAHGERAMNDHDLTAYLVHERLKSVIIDTVRYASEIRDGCAVERRAALEQSLLTKLCRAAEHFDLRVPDPHTLTAIIDTWVLQGTS